MANAGAFGAATQRSDETAGTALEDILVDVLGTGPSEAARVVAAEDVKGRLIRVGALREDHFFLFLRRSDLSDALEELQSGRVTSQRDGQHEWGLALRIPKKRNTILIQLKKN